MPYYSVLSKARTRWGIDAFKYFFECIVFQCAQAGLIDGSKMFTDASLVQADASNNSVVNQRSLKRYLNSCDRKIAPHFNSYGKAHQGTGIRKGIFEPSEFVYNPDDDLYICPTGELLEPRKFKKKRNHFEYSLPAKICNNCLLKPQCTRSKYGRTIKRHVRQDDLDKRSIYFRSNGSTSGQGSANYGYFADSQLKNIEF